MNIHIPWMLILVFFSLATFYYYLQKTTARREKRQERLHESRKALWDSFKTNQQNDNKKGN